MKKLLITALFSTLVLPAMAGTTKDLEKILANKNLTKEISSVLKNVKEQKTKDNIISSYVKANTALDILIKENSELKPLIEKISYTHTNLTLFLNQTKYISEEDFKQTCKDLLFYIDAMALDILEIEKIDKNLAETIEKIVNHQYFLNALAIDANISALHNLVLKYYRPAFYDNMAIAKSSLITKTAKTGYDKEWEDFINDWFTKHSK